MLKSARLVLCAVLVSTCAGCSALAGAGPVLQTARDVARVGCAILEGTDGSSSDVLARTQELQRAILDGAAREAAARGADAARVDQDMRTIAALADTLRAVSASVVRASGDAPAKLTPCPVAAPASAPVLVP